MNFESPSGFESPGTPNESSRQDSVFESAYCPQPEYSSNISRGIVDRRRRTVVNAPLSVSADQGECFIDFADITILGRVENSNFQATFGDVYKGVYRRSGEGVNSCYCWKCQYLV